MVQPSKLYFNWTYQLSSSPEELWPLLSDINRLFKDVKLPVIQTADVTLDSTNHFQPGTEHSGTYTDEPCQWEYPYSFKVKRFYKSGKYKELRLRVNLLPNQKGCRLQFQLWIKPRGTVLSRFNILKLKTLISGRLKTTVRRYDELTHNGLLPSQADVSKHLSRPARKKIGALTRALVNASGEEEIAHRLVNFIQRAEDVDVQHMEPFKVADAWKADRQKTLYTFLHAAKLGLLIFSWDMHCPRCRSIQQSCKTLSEVFEPVSCGECSREFKINFNRTIQLRFSPHPLIRKVGTSVLTPGGAAAKPHVVIQQLLEPGQQRHIKSQLKKGLYRLYSSEADGFSEIRVKEAGKHNVEITLTSSALNREIDLAETSTLTFKNSSPKRQLIRLEKTAWDDHILTAARVTSLQLFRDLFSNEVLSKGEKIAVDELTLMFTDLFDSTGIYKQEGDSKAVNQVIEHFDILQQAVERHGGALVKTIGDSIMAVFCNPSQALKAFDTAQKIISHHVQFGKSLKLKAGIHHGSCVAVNFNNKIDYFGSTVNIASRLVDHANGNEVIISESVATHKEARHLLQTNFKSYTIKDEVTHLKGFGNEQFHVHRVSVGQTVLRLVV